ncbi:FISUMP domain-containing protein [Bacteroidota bacterium]
MLQLSCSESNQIETQIEQYCTLSGTIYRIYRNTVITGAKIEIGNKVDSSDSQGKYKIENVTEGKITLTVTKHDYTTFETQLTLSSGDTTFNIGLTKYCPPTVTIDGQVYNTVKIGDQCWIKENLNVGTMIQGNQQTTDNGIVEKYCYNDDEANCETYGALYQWDELMNYSTENGAQGICPDGWHLPTEADFQHLLSLVDYDGNSLKHTSQGYGGGKSTNTSGFSALLAGSTFNDGTFHNLGRAGLFWSSTDRSHPVYSIYFILDNNTNRALFNSTYKISGLCVRCLKND